jgi:hypothetical protein
MLIKSDVYFGNSVISQPESLIKSESMLLNCDVSNASTLGSTLTNLFLSALPQDWTDGPLIIDSRSHMLMPGWYPCLPGWHHDEVPRTRSDEQPDYHSPFRSKQAMLLLNGDICPTEFALGNLDIDIPEIGSIIYRDWHPIINQACDDKKLTKISAPSNKIIFFTDRTWHQGTQAVKTGNRFFIRATMHFDEHGKRIARPKPALNEIRPQSQVYLAHPFQNW